MTTTRTNVYRFNPNLTTAQREQLVREELSYARAYPREVTHSNQRERMLDIAERNRDPYAYQRRWMLQFHDEFTPGEPLEKVIALFSSATVERVLRDLSVTLGQSSFNQTIEKVTNLVGYNTTYGESVGNVETFVGMLADYSRVRWGKEAARYPEIIADVVCALLRHDYGRKTEYTLTELTQVFSDPKVIAGLNSLSNYYVSEAMVKAVAIIAHTRGMEAVQQMFEGVAAYQEQTRPFVLRNAVQKLHDIVKYDHDSPFVKEVEIFEFLLSDKVREQLARFGLRKADWHKQYTTTTVLMGIREKFGQEVADVVVAKMAEAATTYRVGMFAGALFDAFYTAKSYTSEQLSNVIQTEFKKSEHYDSEADPSLTRLQRFSDTLTGMVRAA